MGVLPHERGDAEARLEALFRRHWRDVAAYVRRRAEPAVVEDVVAETFLVAWRRLDDVPGDARPWLLAVARKTLSTQRRSSARRRSLASRLEATQPSAAVSDSPGEPDVVEALGRLSEKDREAITLVACEELSPGEAAVVVGQSPAAFRVRLHRAKRRLREQLDARPEVRGRAGLGPTDIPLTGGGRER